MILVPNVFNSLKFYVALLFVSMGYFAKAQVYQTRISGSNDTTQSVVNPPFSVGLNTADASNTPGDRQQAMTWQDDDGNYYLFGGIGATGIQYNGLWQFNGTHWILLDASAAVPTANENGVYSGATPRPGARALGVTWRLPNGDVYLFGGHGYGKTGGTGYINDFWKWDGSDWQYLSGDSATGSAGNTDTAAGALMPSARYGAMGWTDEATNTLYLYGGLAFVSGIILFADVWSYSLTSNTWTLVDDPQDDDPVRNQSSGNTPGSRFLPVSYSNGNGDAYVFGGLSASLNRYNDLWKWTGSSQSWSHVVGGVTDSTASNTTDTDLEGVYSGGTTYPGARFQSHGWMNQDGSLWLFGGSGYADTAGAAGDLSDFWKFTPADSSWSFEGGSSDINSGGRYGTLGVYDSTNAISARSSAAVWSTGTGIIFYGGQSPISVNSQGDDLWIAETAENIWNGVAWSQGTANLGNTSDAIVNSSGAFPANSTIVCRELTINPGVSLNTDSVTLEIHGDLFNNGNELILGQGTLDFQQSSGTQVINGDIAFAGIVKSALNAFTASGGRYTILATDENTRGQFVPRNNFFFDTLEFQSYLDLDTGSNNGRYYQISSGFLNASPTQITFNGGGGLMVGGDADPTQNSVWSWGAGTASWTSPSVPFQASRNLRISVYAGNNTFGNFLFSDGQSGSISFKTQVSTGAFTNGGIPSSFYETALSYNNGQSSGVSFVGSGTVAETEGWNLLGNPFQAHFDFFDNSITKPSNLNNAVYVWKGDGTYASYINGVGSNGGSNIIAAGQAFWVQLNSNQSGTISYSEDAINAEASPTLFKTANTVDGVNLSVSDGTLEDDTWMIFDPNASDAFEGMNDAWKMKNNPDVPSIWVQQVNQQFSIATLEYQKVKHVPVHIQCESAHGATLTLTADLQTLYNFVELEDLKTGTRIDLTQHNSYAFTHDTAFSSHRFVVHLAQNNIALEEALEQEPEFFTYNLHQGIELVFSSLPEKARVKVFDAGGALMEETAITETKTKLLQGNHPKGLYILSVSTRLGTSNHKIIF